MTDRGLRGEPIHPVIFNPGLTSAFVPIAACIMRNQASIARGADP